MKTGCARETILRRDGGGQLGSGVEAVPRRTPPAAYFAVFLIVALAFLFVAAAPALAEQANTSRALDYLSAIQRENGGFSDSSATGDPSLTPWAIMAISAASQDPNTWKIGDKDPVTFLRTLDIATVAATGAGSNNTPAFYAKLILAFRAAGRPDLVAAAGQPGVNLATRLLEYRIPEDGHFTLSPANPATADVSTTAWAGLALAAAGGYDAELAQAIEWLRAAQAEDGGFPFQTGGIEDVDDTAAVIQAFIAAGVPAGDPTIQAALAFLEANQNSDGGFVSWVNDPKTTAESTAWAVQAILAAGEDPAAWTVSGGSSPVSYLSGLQTAKGIFEHRKGQTANPLMTTSQALIALNGCFFPFGLQNSAAKPSYAPTITAVSPANNASVKAGSIQVKCEYKDGNGGTGIDTSAVRILVNGEDKTSSATITESALTLTLTAGTAGSHTLAFTVADRAGAKITQEVKFTVTVSTTTTTTRHTATTSGSAGSSTRSGSSGSSGTYSSSGSSSFPGSSSSSYRGISSSSAGVSMPGHSLSSGSASSGSDSASPYSTPPSPGGYHETLYDETTPVQMPGMVSGQGKDSTTSGSFDDALVADSAEITGQTVSLDTNSGGAGVAGFVGGGVLALLPLGIALSVLIQRRQVALLAASIDGTTAEGAADDTGLWSRTATATTGFFGAARDKAGHVAHSVARGIGRRLPSGTRRDD